MRLTKERFLGHLAYLIGQLLKLTFRFNFKVHENYKPRQPYLFAFWHGKQLIPILYLNHHQPGGTAVLVSPSRDGHILSTWLKHLKYKVLRGSSRANNVSALKQTITVLKRGYSFGIAVDGPIGPAYQVKSGITYLSRKLQVPIIPVGSAIKKAKIFHRSWDDYEIPWPFTQVALCLGEPWQVPQEMDLTTANAMLETKLKAINLKSCALIS